MQERPSKAAAAAVEITRPALAGKPRRRMSSSRPLLLLPALLSAPLLLLVLLAGGAKTAASAETGGGLQASVGKVGLEAKEEEKRQPQGLYFFVSSKGPRRCFVITEGRGSIFHVHYDFPAARDAGNDKEILLELRDLSEYSTPKDRFLHQPIETFVINKEEGSHEFGIKKSKKEASYSLCAKTTAKTEGRGLKLYLDMDTGKEDLAYTKAKEDFNLEDVQISMIQLKNTAQQMLRKADYSKDLETLYHQSLLQLNREVLWWPVSQVVILVIMGVYQVRHLKKFFRSKRLV